MPDVRQLEGAFGCRRRCRPRRSNGRGRSGAPRRRLMRLRGRRPARPEHHGRRAGEDPGDHEPASARPPDQLRGISTSPEPLPGDLHGHVQMSSDLDRRQRALRGPHPSPADRPTRRPPEPRDPRFEPRAPSGSRFRARRSPPPRRSLRPGSRHAGARGPRRRVRSTPDG